jgi:hypothetical protein
MTASGEIVAALNLRFEASPPRKRGHRESTADRPSAASAAIFAPFWPPAQHASWLAYTTPGDFIVRRRRAREASLVHQLAERSV